MPRGGRARGAQASEGNFLLSDAHAFGEIPNLLWRHGGVEGDVRNGAALGAKQVGVLLKVGAEAGGFALMVDRAYEAGGSEAFEAVVNRGQRNGGHAVLDPHENFDRARVVGSSH